MTSEQLQATRAIRWRQNSDPILTLEDAQAFLQQTGLCLFLPRKTQLNAPAPSFVEACLGVTNPTPPRAAIEVAHELLARLIDANQAIALNLLGTPADHPDFIVSPDTLPFVFAMRGDRDWKHAPGSGTTRVSPLVQQVWKVLERKGVLTADELKDEIGRELTEAAALRALYELWGAMRVTPLYQNDGEPTLWEALQTRQQKALNAGTNMSQVTALSVLVSLYLESAVAATGDEVEIFLSPLTSRSKVREAVRGLTATRQLAMISMERETLLHVEGSLPEFDEALAISHTPAGVGEDAAVTERRAPRRSPADGKRPHFRPAAGSDCLSIKSAKPKLADTISVWPRPAPPAQELPALEVPPSAPREHSRPRVTSSGGIRSFAASGAAPRRERTPARPPWKDKGKPGFAKSAAAKGEKARWPRERAPGGPPRQAPPATGEGVKPRPWSGGEKQQPVSKPYSRSKSSAPGTGFKSRGDIKPGGGFRPRDDSRPRSSRPLGEQGGSRPPYRSTSRPAAPREASAPLKPRADFKDFKARKPGDFKRSSGTGSGARPGGFKPRFGGKPSGERPSYGGSRGTGQRDRPASRPGSEFRQPWKDGASRPPRPTGTRPGGARASGPGQFKPRSAESPSAGYKPRSASSSGTRTFRERPRGDAPGGFKPGFKGGFKWPSSTGSAGGGFKGASKPGFKSAPRSGTRPNGPSGGAGARPPRPGGFAKRSGPASGPSSYKGPSSRGSASRGGASRGTGSPGTSTRRPAGPPRPGFKRRKPE